MSHPETYPALLRAAQKSREKAWAALLHRAETEPIGLALTDYGDEFCEGFLAGQRSVLEEIEAERLSLPSLKDTP